MVTASSPIFSRESAVLLAALRALRHVFQGIILEFTEKTKALSGRKTFVEELVLTDIISNSLE